LISIVDKENKTAKGLCKAKDFSSQFTEAMKEVIKDENNLHRM